MPRFCRMRTSTIRTMTFPMGRRKNQKGKVWMLYSSSSSSSSWTTMILTRILLFILVFILGFYNSYAKKIPPPSFEFQSHYHRRLSETLDLGRRTLLTNDGNDDDRYNNGPNENDVTNAPYSASWSSSPSFTPSVSPFLSPPSNMPSSSSSSSSSNAPSISPTQWYQKSHLPTSWSSNMPSLTPTESSVPPLCTSDMDGNFGNFTNVQEQVLSYNYEIQLHSTFINPNIHNMSNLQYMQLIIVPALEIFMLDYLIQHLFQHCQSHDTTTTTSSSSSSNNNTSSSISRHLQTPITYSIKALSTKPRDEQTTNSSCTYSNEGGRRRQQQQQRVNVNSSSSSSTEQKDSNCAPIRGQMSFYWNEDGTSLSRRNQAGEGPIRKSLASEVPTDMITNMTQTLISLIQTGMDIDAFVPAHEAIQKVIFVDHDPYPVDDDSDDVNATDDNFPPKSTTKLKTSSIIGIVLGAIGLLSVCCVFVSWRSRSKAAEEKDDADDWIEVQEEENQTEEEEKYHDENHADLESRNFNVNPHVSMSHTSQEETVDMVKSSFHDWDYDIHQNRHSNLQSTDTNDMNNANKNSFNPVHRRRTKQPSNWSQHSSHILSSSEDNSSDGAGHIRDIQSTGTMNSGVEYTNHGNFKSSLSQLGSIHEDSTEAAKYQPGEFKGNQHDSADPASDLSRNSSQKHSTQSFQDDSSSPSRTQDSNRAVRRNDTSVISQGRSERSKHKRPVRDYSSNGPFPFLHRAKPPTTTIQQSTQGSFDFFDLVLDDVNWNPDHDSHISDIT